MADTRRFWNLLSGFYARQKIADEDAYRRKLAETQAHFTPDMRVREVGAGTGSTAVIHAPHVASYEVVDFSPRMLDIARQRAADAGVKNLTFRAAGLEDLDANGDFDAVLALSLIHLLKDRDAGIAHMAKMLKPGGLFVSSTTCLGGQHGWLKLIGPIPRALGLFPMLKHFTRDELETSIRQAGFEILDSWQPSVEKNAAVFIIARKAS